MKKQQNQQRTVYALVALLLLTVSVFFMSSSKNPGSATAAGRKVVADPTTTTKPKPKPTKFVYLTFDDGPVVKYTPKILDILRDNDAKATFFVTGRNVNVNPKLTKRMASEGHSVENHSYSHRSLRNVPQDVFNYEIDATNDKIKDATGKRPKCLRPPYDDFNQGVVERVKQKKMKLSLYTVDSLDWKKPGKSVIVNDVLAKVKPNSVILFHDGGGTRDQTVAALRDLLPKLSKLGYGFRAMCR